MVGEQPRTIIHAPLQRSKPTRNIANVRSDPMAAKKKAAKKKATKKKAAKKK